MPVPAAPQPPPMHPPAYQPFQYPSMPNGSGEEKKYPLGGGSNSPPPKFPGFNIPPGDDFKELNVNYQVTKFDKGRFFLEGNTESIVIIVAVIIPG